MAQVNEMQYSSMPRDSLSGLSLYPFRAYEPNFQRWLNQDPIQESGGVNIYKFVRNSPLNFLDSYGLTEEGSEAAFGETEGLYPQLTQLPKGQVHQPSDIYRPTDWDPNSYQALQNTRQFIADIRERNKQTRMANGSKAKNSIDKRAWTDCEAAAKLAEKYQLPKGIDHFTLRQGPIVPGQNNPDKLGFTPEWAAGMTHYQEGPFVNVGGGDVPKGPATYVDFWETPSPPATKK